MNVSSQTIPIPMTKRTISYENFSNEIKTAVVNNERDCKLDANIFDPTKGSPPNPWILKLENRINNYYTIQYKS